MPGHCNIQRETGVISATGRGIEADDSEYLKILPAEFSNGIIYAAGTRVSFYRTQRGALTLAAGVREIHTEPPKCLSHGSEAKTS